MRKLGEWLCEGILNICEIKKEDYLRNRLVDDYLENELCLFEHETDHFTVNKEVSEEYRGLVDDKLHNDPIDIHIIDKAQKNSWGKNTKPYFAIECKRLTSSSVTEYVTDTKKFTERNYTKSFFNSYNAIRKNKSKTFFKFGY